MMSSTNKSARKRLVSTALTTTIILCLVSTSSTATAAQESEVDELASQVADAAEVAAEGSSSVTVAGGVDVAVPKELDQGIALVAGDLGFTFSGPAGVETQGGQTAADGSTVYLGETGNDPTVSVAPLEDGVRISTIIDSADQASQFSYPLEDGTHAELQPDGSVLIFREEPLDAGGSRGIIQAIVAKIQPAWALDAQQANVDTWYEVTDDAVIQHVDHSDAHAYPVIADPQVSATGLLQIRIRWTKAETKTISQQGYAAGPVTAACAAAGLAIAGPAGAAIGAAACIASAVSIIAPAQNAVNSKRCLEYWLQYVPVGFGISFAWTGTYTGGYCR
jgi:hypothetical protein